MLTTISRTSTQSRHPKSNVFEWYKYLGSFATTTPSESIRFCAVCHRFSFLCFVLATQIKKVLLGPLMILQSATSPLPFPSTFRYIKYIIHFHFHFHGNHVHKTYIQNIMNSRLRGTLMAARSEGSPQNSPRRVGSSLPTTTAARSRRSAGRRVPRP